eukprot:s627_g42.t1
MPTAKLGCKRTAHATNDRGPPVNLYQLSKNSVDAVPEEPTNIDAQRILAIMDELKEKLTFLSFVSAQVLGGLQGEDGSATVEILGPELMKCFAEQLRLEDLYVMASGEGGYGHNEETEEMREDVKSLQKNTLELCRKMKAVPNVVQELRNFQDRESRPAAMIQFLKTLADMQELTLKRLSTTVEEEKSRQELLEHYKSREAEASARRQQLDRDLAHIRRECERAQSHRNEILTKLKADLINVKVRNMVTRKLPPKPGEKLALYHGISKLMLDKTLQEQGILGMAVTLSCTFCPTDLSAAWLFVQGNASQEDELALEGVIHLEGATTSEYLYNLPQTLQSLKFGDQFNQSLAGVTFPSTLQSLTFGKQFNQSLAGVTFPSNLQTLTFGKQFNQSLASVTFPSNLQSLTLGGLFNQSLAELTFPSNLQSLTLGGFLKQSLASVTFPSTLQSLTFGIWIDQSLAEVTFPSNLQSLTVYGRFSLAELTFPSNLQSLTFGDHFNEGLAGVTFPSNLQSLAFGKEFNRNLVGVTFPSNLQSLKISGWVRDSLAGVTFPSTLQTLTFGDRFNQSLAGVTFPRALQSLTVFWFSKSLAGVTFPSTLQSLQLELGIGICQNLAGVTLPSNLQSLEISGWVEDSLAGVTFPSNLQSLTLGGLFNQSLAELIFPSNLQSLTLGAKFNQSLAGVTFPSDLQSLTLGAKFNQSLAGVTFPTTLQTLTLGAEFNQSLAGVTFPSDLQSLTFGDHFNQCLASAIFPSNLQSLRFGHGFNQNLAGVTLPRNLKTLQAHGVADTKSDKSSALKNKYDQRMKEHQEAFESKREELQKKINTLLESNKKLKNQSLDEEMDQIRKAKRYEMDVDGVITRYDSEVKELAKNYSENAEHLKKEQRQLNDLREHFQKVEEENMAITKEEDLRFGSIWWVFDAKRSKTGCPTVAAPREKFDSLDLDSVKLEGCSLGWGRQISVNVQAPLGEAGELLRAAKECLGQGACSSVYRGRQGDKEVALKLREALDEDMIANCREEFEVLRQLRHPNIIQALDFFVLSQRTCLVLSYHDARNLTKAVKMGPMPEATAKPLFRMLLKALDYLHCKRVLHRDVKGDNVLVSHDDTQLWLADFNTARQLMAGGSLTMTGTWEYSPPEVIVEGESASEKADVWGAGLCGYLMLKGKLPLKFSAYESPRAYGEACVKNPVTCTGPSWEAFSSDCCETLRRCLHVDKNCRPAAMVLLAMSWLADSIVARRRLKPGRRHTLLSGSLDLTIEHGEMRTKMDV